MLGYTRRDSLAENRAIMNKQVCILKLFLEEKFHIYIYIFSQWVMRSLS